ncbi:hypothetical protein [Halorubrum vacuolatum]|nr:hypothetical protein [Halorubrum vacuolatum]
MEGWVYYPGRSPLGMMARFGFERRDGRNLLVVAAIMTAVMTIVIDAPIVARLIAGMIMGLVSALVFVITTVLIRRYKPDHW